MNTWRFLKAVGGLTLLFVVILMVLGFLSENLMPPVTAGIRESVTQPLLAAGLPKWLAKTLGVLLFMGPVIVFMAKVSATSHTRDWSADADKHSENLKTSLKRISETGEFLDELRTNVEQAAKREQELSAKLEYLAAAENESSDSLKAKLAAIAHVSRPQRHRDHAIGFALGVASSAVVALVMKLFE